MSVKSAVLFTVLFTLICFSCWLVDLSELEISSVPAEANTVLAADQSISFGFSQEVQQISFESIFRLSGPSGTEDGDFSWDGLNAEFTPNCSLQPGFRYRLKISGDIETPDGRIFTKNINIPFYYLTGELPPVLESVTPAEAATVGVDQSLVLTFSKPLDTETFDEGFSISPGTEYEQKWNNDETIVTLNPKDQWLNLHYYSWTLSDDITDKSHIPLAGDVEGAFLVQLDQIPPEVTGLYPASNNGDGSFTVLTALEPDDLLQGMHLAATFSESIDFDSLRQNLSIDPSIDGYLLLLSPDSAVYYIDEALPPDSSYEMTITEELEDLSGNLMRAEWEQSFTPDIPAQHITGIDIEGNNGTHNLTAADFNTGEFIEIPGLDYYDGGKLHFIVNLSSAFPVSDFNGRLAFESTIGITPVFPPGTTAPSVYTTSWESETELTLIYKDFESCDTGEPVYYKFKINTGGPDSAAHGGSYLLDEIEFIFLAEKAP